MSVAYVDTSCLVALAFDERGAAALARRLAQFTQLVSSNLLEAELRAVFARERRVWAPESTGRIAYVLPDRPLGPEIERVLEAGYLRGADCWHLASALYLASDPALITFMTLDRTQAQIAEAIGFRK
ncbi:MAG: PIN domain-containing protein [Gemmatimonadaceae bacterium]